MRPFTHRFQRIWWLQAVLAAAFFVSTGCKTETSPTFNGITGDTLFTVEGGGVTMDVAVIRPAAVATISKTTLANIEFSVRCKFPNSGTRWAFYFLREDESARVFGPAAGCPQSILQAQQTFGGQNASEYEFLKGHTTRFRLAVAANADALLNGGPYIYLGTRDIVTWTFE